MVYESTAVIFVYLLDLLETDSKMSNDTQKQSTVVLQIVFELMNNGHRRSTKILERYILDRLKN